MVFIDYISLTVFVVLLLETTVTSRIRSDLQVNHILLACSARVNFERMAEYSTCKVLLFRLEYSFVANNHILAVAVVLYS